MRTNHQVAVVTGASGYLGSQICHTLESRGWQVIRLTGSREPVPGRVLRYELSEPVSDEVTAALRIADVLIHAAYNLSLTGADDIWRVNVEGTRRLLEAAKQAGTRKVIVLSSMSAFTGTSQLYGRAKLDIEAMTVEFGGQAIRPGLVYGKEAGGMAGALRKLGGLPVVPVIAGGAGVYTVAENDLMEVVMALASAEDLQPGTISVAHGARVTLAELINAFAEQRDRRPRFIPVPWRLVYFGLKSGELMRLPLPFRADSLLGLVYSAPSLIGQEQLDRLAVPLRPFKEGLAA